MSKDVELPDSEQEKNTAEDKEIQETQEEQEVREQTEPSLEEQLAGEKEKFLRLFAEFENYKKRTQKERLELFRTAGQEVIQALLPVLDDFDRALAEMNKAGADQWIEGVGLIHQKFTETLRQKGLEPIELEQGAAFDPELHEAVTQIPSPEESLKGKVIDVVETGYRLGDKIIRHPKVVVGQ